MGKKKSKKFVVANTTPKMAPDGSDKTGNTSVLSEVKRIHASKRWIFTWNNYPLDCLAQLALAFESFDKWGFGYEIAPDTGTPHLQGYVEFYKKSRPIERIKIPEIHWEKCKGNQLDNLIYITKDGDYHLVGFKWRPPRKLTYPFGSKGPYLWQMCIMHTAKITCTNDRQINWIWCKKGNSGKTSLCRWLVRNTNCILLSGKAHDIKYGVTTALEKFNNQLDVVIFHFPRSKEDYVSYDAIESVKDGLFYSGKYDAGMADYDSPHVYVFANFPPKLEQLSKDKWNVIQLDQVQGEPQEVPKIEDDFY